MPWEEKWPHGPRPIPSPTSASAAPGGPAAGGTTSSLIVKRMHVLEGGMDVHEGPEGMGCRQVSLAGTQ